MPYRRNSPARRGLLGIICFAIETGFSGLTCYTGTVVEMMDQASGWNQLLYDDTKEVKCSAMETECWWQVTESNHTHDTGYTTSNTLKLIVSHL